jgi:hypothetical protein
LEPLRKLVWPLRTLSSTLLEAVAVGGCAPSSERTTEVLKGWVGFVEFKAIGSPAMGTVAALGCERVGSMRLVDSVLAVELMFGSGGGDGIAPLSILLIFKISKINV